MRLGRIIASGLSAMLAFLANAAWAQSVYPDPDELENSEETNRVMAPGGVADAISRALRHNPEISIAEARLDNAESGRFRALGEFLPNIEASLAYTNDDFRSTVLNSLEERDGTTLGLSVSQPVFTGLSTLNRFKEARHRKAQFEMLLIDSQQRIALQAAGAHAGVILARENIEHRIENYNLLDRMFEVATRRMKAGAQSRTGVEQARLRRSQAQVALGEARAALAREESAFARIVGIAPPVELIAGDDEYQFDFDSLDEAVALAVDRNPALSAARKGFEAATSASAATKGAFSPSLSIEGNYFRRYGDAVVAADEEEYQIVARARLPIFNQGRNIADLKSAAAAKTEAGAQVRATRLIVEEAINRSWRQYIDAQARQIAAREAIEAANVSIKGLQIEYEAGQRTVVDVLDGQRDLVTARLSQSQAVHDARIAQYEIAAATGALLSIVEP